MTIAFVTATAEVADSVCLRGAFGRSDQASKQRDPGGTYEQDEVRTYQDTVVGVRASVVVSSGAPSFTAATVVKRSYAEFEVFASLADCTTITACVEQFVLTPATAALATNRIPAVTNFLRVRPNALALSTGALRVATTPNAGGASIVSETLSFEVLHRMLGLELVATETEMVVFPRNGTPMLDYLACMAGCVVVGVSVTRAMAFGRKMTTNDAVRLLRKKLGRLPQAAASAFCGAGRVSATLLHVWARTGAEAAIIKRALARLNRQAAATAKAAAGACGTSAGFVDMGGHRCMVVLTVAGSGFKDAVFMEGTKGAAQGAAALMPKCRL